MVGHVVSRTRLLRQKTAPLWVAAALLCAGCAGAERDILTISQDRTHEGLSSSESLPPLAPSAPAPADHTPAISESAGPAGTLPGHGSDSIKSQRDGSVDPNGSAAAATSSPAAAGSISLAGDASAATAGPGAQNGGTPPAAADKPAVKKKFSIPVLNYHSIDVNPDNNAVLDPKKLDEQMAHLANEGYKTLTLREFIDIWDGKREAPDKAVLLTFDDGYTDNYTNAMPILKKYDFRATIFVSVGMTGQDGYFADWDQIRAMRDAGWDIQPHGATHPYLNKLSAEEQELEIAESIKQLKEHTGVDTLAFCYPYGNRNATTLKLLEKHGVRFAFTIDQGRTEPSQSPLELKRIFIGGKESMATFLKKLK
ncbi:MAG: polysaccharide deacetylase family protein [Paenibacillus sp.]|uniref:polysaccharide deacetylase family protein n=1 Tax=Paenibacillus sp. GCM10012303 TaxID=3317340 RepID=UPI0029E8EDD9|nr:polysaccharide deacetylase family protein [Paenibacillus sp.]